MKSTITYEVAVKSMKALIAAKIVDGFTASTILATFFDRNKEDTINDLIGIK